MSPMQSEPPPGAQSAMSAGTQPAGTGGKGEQMPAADFSFVVLRKFASKYLKGHIGMIMAYVVGHLLVQTILPQQAAVYLGKLTNHFSSGGSAKGAPGMGNSDLLGTYGFWIAATVILLIAGFGYQWLVARMDGKITNGVKADLFSNILRQPPRFFHQHDSDRLTMIVNQYSN